MGTNSMMKPQATAGRPSTYTESVAREICRLIAEGNSMRRVCLMSGMPDRGTLLKWADVVPEFAHNLARAREDCADWHADQGLEELHDSKGQTKEHVAAARELAKYHLSLARVIDPRRYSERFEVEHSGAIQGGLGPVIISITAHAPAVVSAIDVLPAVNIGQVE